MKRMVVATLLAVGLTAASQDRASAWCKFNFGAGVNMCYENGGGTWTFGIHRKSEQAPPPGAAVPYPVPASGAAAPAAGDSNGSTPGSAPALPPGTLPAPTPKPANGPQPAAYFTPTGSSYGYAAYQARGNPSAVPSYWYDK
jgi:hypothetical protein